MKKLDYNHRILVPRFRYDLKSDKRFLVSFVCGTKIGFANIEGEIMIEPRFDFVLDDFTTKNSIVRVGETYAKVYSPNASKTYLYQRFGLLKSDGSFFIPMEYEGISMPVFSDAITLRSLTNGYAVIDFDGNFIIPFGLYNYIGGFDHGFARIKIGGVAGGLFDSDGLWGILNDKGEVILKPEYKRIQNFYDKSQLYTKVITTDNSIFEFHFNDGSLRENGYQAMLDRQEQKEMDDYRLLQEYRESMYWEYNGTYAQDIMGYSDQDIDDAFDGEPDAYWNID